YAEEQAYLSYLKGEKKEEIVRRIEEARSRGDLSENAEYDEALNEQRDNEAEIARLTAKLSRDDIIFYDEGQLTNDEVRIGNFVKVECLWNGKVVDYQVVGSSEANPLEGKISNNSPVGSALIGKKIGDVVSVQVPAGVREYKVLDIRIPD
ncbi:MAG: transcription elongation factor GreA, partial [Clostridia bacterium]|nr:transcription elongation factor GreA [Clostridia bacterium]